MSRKLLFQEAYYKSRLKHIESLELREIVIGQLFKYLFVLTLSQGEENAFNRTRLAFQSYIRLLLP